MWNFPEACIQCNRVLIIKISCIKISLKAHVHKKLKVPRNEGQ